MEAGSDSTSSGISPPRPSSSPAASSATRRGEVTSDLPLPTFAPFSSAEYSDCGSSRLLCPSVPLVLGLRKRNLNEHGGGLQRRACMVQSAWGRFSLVRTRQKATDVSGTVSRERPCSLELVDKAPCSIVAPHFPPCFALSRTRLTAIICRWTTLDADFPLYYLNFFLLRSLLQATILKL